MDKRKVLACVKEINWERIWLHLVVQLRELNPSITPDQIGFFLIDQDNTAQAKMQVEKIEDDLVYLRINVTNAGNGYCLAQGTYTMAMLYQGDIIGFAEVDESYVALLDNATRNFLYANFKRSYSVNFFLAEDEDILLFKMHVLASAKVGMGTPTNAQYTLASPKKSFIASMISKLKKSYSKHSRQLKIDMYWHFRKKYKKKKRKTTVLFLSEQSTSISTNLAAVRNRMYARGMDQDYEILGSFRSSVTQVKMGMKSWIDTMKKIAKSDYIFMDDHAPVFDWLRIDEETVITQLWHAGAGFKSSGYSRWGHIGCPSPYSCHRQYKYGIAGSKNIAHFFSEVWGINDSQVLPTGMPRIDEFLDEDYKQKKIKALREKYELCNGKKVILFAPTYRGKNKATAHYPYELIDFDRLYDLCGEEYVVFFKMHPWVASSVPIPKKYKDRFVDVNKYPNINDLFYITDLLITDYSSNIFEYSLMKNPMLFFAFDEMQYSFSRGFHRPYEESAPGKVCHTFDELLEAIANKDFEYEKVLEYVEKHFDYIDSHASDRVIDWILLGQMPEAVLADIEKDKQIIQEVAAIKGPSTQMEQDDEE